MLSPHEQATLFGLARRAVEAHLSGDAPPALPSRGGALSEVRGAFVTLRREGKLRGCVGHSVGRQPLVEAVRELAVASGFRDRRFPPLRAEELVGLEIELSVLSAPTPIDPEAVEVGRHGLLVRGRGRAGLLLPQVAEERGWDVQTFLQATCRKAGLELDAWRDPGIELLGFEGEVYDEG